MSLSGSQDFTITRDELIKASLQHISAIGDGVTPSATQLSESALLLNMLIKHWQTDDIQLWIRKLGYVLPISGINKTALGAEGGHATNSYNYTTTSAASLSGASTITVTSTTGITDTYYIGVELSDGTMQWTTVSGAPAGQVVTLAAALTGDVASGAAVYCYESKIKRPLRILDAYRRLSSDDTDTSLTRLTQQEYNAQSNKFSEGVPNSYFYDEVLSLSTTLHPGNGDFYFWPIFENGDEVIVIQYTKVFDDLDAASNNVEFPQTWFLPLMVGLAWLLAPKHGIPLKERQMLFQEMTILKDAAKNYDQELGSLFLTVNRDRY